MKQKVWINGFEFWFDGKALFEKESDTSGTSFYSSHVTPNERKQVLDQLHYDRDKR